MDIDLTPLQPIVNGLIDAATAILAAAIPVATAYAIAWIRSRLKVSNQQVLDMAGTALSDLMTRAVKYDPDVLHAIVKDNLTKVHVTNKTVAAVANYVISQAPDTLKAAGMNPATKEGQEAVVRWATAKLTAPPPPKPDAVIQVEAAPKPAGG